MQIVGVDVWLHSSGVHSFALFKINYVELYLLLTTISDCKVEPLSMSSRIRISSHEQIILVLADFDANIQVAALKVTVEN